MASNYQTDISIDNNKLKKRHAVCGLTTSPSLIVFDLLKVYPTSLTCVSHCVASL